MLSRDHNILWLPESNGYPTRTILGATLVTKLQPAAAAFRMKAHVDIQLKRTIGEER